MQEHRSKTIRRQPQCSDSLKNITPKSAQNESSSRTPSTERAFSSARVVGVRDLALRLVQGQVETRSPRLLLALLFITIFTASAVAGTQDNVYSVGLSMRNLYLVNANGTVTNIFTNYTGTASAAMALRAR